MGSQNAEYFSNIGDYEVCIMDLNDEVVNKGFQTIKRRLEDSIPSVKLMQEEKKNILDGIKVGMSIEEVVKEVD
jgi:3-hydroxyacyl-CoA dehydrogenase